MVTIEKCLVVAVIGLLALWVIMILISVRKSVRRKGEIRHVASLRGAELLEYLVGTEEKSKK